MSCVVAKETKSSWPEGQDFLSGVGRVDGERGRCRTAYGRREHCLVLLWRGSLAQSGFPAFLALTCWAVTSVIHHERKLKKPGAEYTSPAGVGVMDIRGAWTGARTVSGRRDAEKDLVWEAALSTCVLGHPLAQKGVAGVCPITWGSWRNWARAEMSWSSGSLVSRSFSVKTGGDVSHLGIVILKSERLGQKGSWLCPFPARDPLSLPC